MVFPLLIKEGGWGVVKFGVHPLLPLVFAEVQHGEGLDLFDGEEALAGGMNGEAAKIAGDPAAAKLFGGGGGRAGAAE